ncbi:glycerophosphoinositol inositolphosphodiesterase GDPD2-like isoform X2 [Dysidea avara]|uniref:glycerophosphoinositol inositolphosphodiesterase GDPD2-like isoform X2 n=1 Tax=Dysidea avara TaxID=196820 RepID=UPI0033307A17
MIDSFSFLCIPITLSTTLFWIALDPVEVDIQDDINWYIFTHLHLLHIMDYQDILKYCSFVFLPVEIFIALFKSWCKPHVRLKRFVILAKAVELCLLIFNCVLLLFLIFKARKLLYLLKLYFSYLLVKLASSHIIVTPQVVTSFVILCLVCFIMRKFTSFWEDCNQRNDPCCFMKKCIFVTVFYILFVFIRACVIYVIIIMSVNCIELPAKPLLTAHRGCKDDFPENSLAAFEGISSNNWLKSVSILETDVHISYNGVPFLLHDDTLPRTTDVLDKCPTLNPLTPASNLNYSVPGSTCDLKDLMITAQAHLPLRVMKNKQNLMLPTFDHFLKIATAHNKTIIFDIGELTTTHPYYNKVIQLLIDTLRNSGIKEDKVWWLYKENRTIVRDAFPHMIQATKTKDTPYEEFDKNWVSLINDEWTIPPHLIKKYQDVGLKLNIWVINSRPLFEMFWCYGVDSVTTNSCDYLDKLNINTYHQAYKELYHVSDSIGVYVSIVVLIVMVFYQKRNAKQTPSDYSYRLLIQYCILIVVATICHVYKVAIV